MLEINLKAKPFHPCESLLGAELFHMCRRTQMVGRNYYNPMCADPARMDILMQLKPQLSFNALLKHLKNIGWADKAHTPALQNYYQFIRGSQKLFVATGSYHYESMKLAQEMCKYLASFSPEKPLDKLMVLEIHRMVMFHETVSTDANGVFTNLNPHVDDDQGFGGGAIAAGAAHVAHQWAAQAQAQHAPNGLLPGQVFIHQQEGAMMGQVPQPVNPVNLQAAINVFNEDQQAVGGWVGAQLGG